MKKSLMDREKIFTSDMTDKELISKMYKELIQLNTKNTNNPEFLGGWIKNLTTVDQVAAEAQNSPLAQCGGLKD